MESVKTDKGISLIYTVVEKPIVRAITITGNKEIASDKLRDAIDLKTNSVFSSGLLAKSVKKIKTLYANEGYYLAEVDSSTTKSGKNGIRVTFSVKEGDKVLIKKISFEGNKVFSPRKLRKQMETKEKWFLSWITGSGAYKEDVLKSDVNRIADLYYNNGYINVKVADPQVTLLPDKSGLLVTIGITEGDQFRTGTIDLKVIFWKGKDVLQGKVKLKSGEVFSRESFAWRCFYPDRCLCGQGVCFYQCQPTFQD